MDNKEEYTGLSLDYLEKVADCLKLLSHPVRLKIIDILSMGKFPVGKIAEMCDVPANQACEHLRLLKNAGLLGSTRDGREVYYYIDSDQVTSLLSCIKKNCCQK